jgi:hypothetical protein
MSLLGKPLGVFKLDESDKYVGSFISKKDVKSILGVNDEDLKDVQFKELDGCQYIDETILRKKYWEKGTIPHARPSKIGNSTISLDEYILIEIIRRTYPKAQIQSQFKWGRKYIDIYVEIGKREFFIEFHGPGHFKKLSIYRDPENPFDRKKQIEKDFNIPCYIWPYWIQRCSTNLKILLEDNDVNERGYGALWSTKVFFGEFFFENSAQIIRDITDSFKAAPDGYYGYFYEEWNEKIGRVKEAHPIIKKILDGKSDVSVLIPKGIKTEERNNWLPLELLN